jgi:amidase
MPRINDTAFAFVPYPDSPLPSASSGPLEGLSFAVKDLFDVQGYPTGGGNPHILALSGIKTTTAPTVTRLLAAGARFVGKTITDELAYSMNGINAHFGAPINGGAKDRVTGGSSSGSAAAVSNGLCDFALGTDTGGSVRCPASHCGLFGIRPTHGRISLSGALALAPSQDTCGFFARDIETFARVADCLYDADTSPLPETIRAFFPRDAWSHLDAGAEKALAPALARVESVLGETTEVVVSEGHEENYWAFRHIQGFEAWASFGETIEKYRLQLGPGVKERFEWGSTVGKRQYWRATVRRKAFTRTLENLLGNDGILVLPTMPDIAPLRDADEDSLQAYRFAAQQTLYWAVLSGFPQLSLPLATKDGAPLGLSLLGPAGSDLSLIRWARKILRAKS